MSLVYFLDYVSSNINFSSNYSLYFRMRVITASKANIHFGLGLSVLSRNTNKISVCNWPLTFIPHIVDFEDFWLFIKYLDL